MISYVFCSFKGGTAKTSSALHIGASLAKYHSKRVLLVDFDPQANLSRGLGADPDSLESIVPVLQGQRKAMDVIQTTSIRGLDLIAANTYLDGIEATAPLVNDLFAHLRLKKALSGLSYDYCLIDTPPSLGWLTQSAFYASQHSIICAVPEPYSILALNRLKEYHESLAQNEHFLTCQGVIVTFWDKRGSTNQVYLNAIETAFPGLVFPSKVRRDVAVNRAIIHGKPVIISEAKSRASQDYQKLTKEFLQRAKYLGYTKGVNKNG
jgi:chromosome partitioning protein